MNKYITIAKYYCTVIFFKIKQKENYNIIFYSYINFLY